ncbi:MAG: Fe-S cluster assembly protein SufD [Acidimicrobiales bacterium]
MTTYTPLDPTTMPGPASLQALRARALKRFEAGPLPTDADEIWRYSRIGELDVGSFAPSRPAAPAGRPPRVGEVLDLIGPRAAFALTVDGAVASVEVDESAASAGLRVHTVRDGDGVGELSSAVQPWDAFVELNSAQASSPLVVAVPPGAEIADPVVICHWIASGGTVTFPRTLITAAPNARVTVVEYLLSDDITAWVDPVTEVVVADGGHVEHLVVQELGPRVWQTAYLASRVGRAGGLRSFTVALGGEYARVRTDSRIPGAGGSAELLALYCGDHAQMHDFRTLQDHQGPKSHSDLVFKGAVQDEARSAYSGMIHIHRGAAGTNAFQTNRNLVLSDTGLATYSVPNLDIEENDVSCSHASATGPIDADQRFYLESRGVPTEEAERLIVLGFFDDLLARLPVTGLRAHLGAAIGTKLAISGPVTASSGGLSGPVTGGSSGGLSGPVAGA